MSLTMEEERRRKQDTMAKNLFDAYKLTVMMLGVSIVYNIVAGGLGYLGYWLAAVRNNFDFLEFFNLIFTDPEIITTLDFNIGVYLLGVALVLGFVGILAAFLYTAAKNKVIKKPPRFFKAYISTWGILFQFALILVVFGALYFGMTYVTNPLASMIAGIIFAVVAGFTPFAMLHRVVDYLIELR
jgi:hypothetical protein